MIILATGILALAASLFHLGRPWRAPLAILRLSTSWLSREVILFGLFLLTLGCYSLMPILNWGSQARNLVGFAAVIIGFAGTIASGETYRLRARPSWDQWLAVLSFPLGALSAGSLFGFFVARQFSGPCCGHKECLGWSCCNPGFGSPGKLGTLHANFPGKRGKQAESSIGLGTPPVVTGGADVGNRVSPGINRNWWRSAVPGMDTSPAWRIRRPVPVFPGKCPGHS